MENKKKIVQFFLKNNNIFFRDELPTTLALPTSLRDSDSRQHLSSMALLGKGNFKNIPFLFVLLTIFIYFLKNRFLEISHVPNINK